MSERYNGWSSYETWLIGVEIGPDVFKDEMESIWRAETNKHESEYEHLLAVVARFKDELKERVYEIAEWGLAAGGDHTIARSLVYAGLSDVDWYELAQAWIDGFREEFGESWPALAKEQEDAV